MNKEREALRMALEALTATMSTHGFKDAIDEAQDKAITAIKEALQSNEQVEPVAWLYERKDSITNVHLEKVEGAFYRGWTETPLYTHPPVPTAHPEQDIPKIGCVNHDCDKCKAQPEQKPVGHSDGYWCDDLTCKKCYSADFRFKHKNSVDKECLTTPPQRKPLTDEQLRAVWEPLQDALCLDYKVFARAIEAAHGIKE